MKHSELNDIARRWLMRAESAKGPGCKIAFNEVGAVGDSERADAWGYRWGWEACSVVVEVKVSRSDFLRDKHKPHRQAGGLGDYRYYMCPEGVINIQDLPDKWGLLWVNTRGHVKVLAGHVTSTFAVPCYVNEELIPKCYCLREYAPLWRHDCNMDTERALMAYMVARVGDPDALLQQQREYVGKSFRQTHEIEQLKKELKHANAERLRYKRALMKEGWIDPVQATEIKPIRRVG